MTSPPNKDLIMNIPQNRHNMKFLLLPLLLSLPIVSTAAPVPIDSSVLNNDAKTDKKFGIGGTASVAQRPFIGVDDQTTSLPYFSFSYKRFYVEGTNLGIKIIEKEKYHLDFLVTPRYFEVKESFASDGELNGIGKTNPTLFAGVTSQYNTTSATYTVQLLSDLKESDGTELNASISKTFKASKTVTLSPSFALNLQDENLVDHFYGVQADETAVNRPIYKGKSTLNYNASLTSVWNVTSSIQLIGQIKVDALGKGITDSPIVDEKTITSYVIGTVYRF